MGQSQPTSIAPQSATINNDTLLTKKQLETTSTLINKLNNPKMVPIHIYEAHINSSTIVPTGTMTNKSQALPFNEENCSKFERELPNELFLQILSFLNNRELIKLGRVCKNFKYYWIENSDVWFGRSFGGLYTDCDEPSMYFKPILDTPIQTMVYYYTYFLPTIVNSFKQCNQPPQSSQMNAIMALLGCVRIGKSTLMKRVLNPNMDFDPIYNQTLGVQFIKFGYECNNNNNQMVKVNLWDLSGDPRFTSMLRIYSNSAKLLIYCFDLSNVQTFIDMKELIRSYGNFNSAGTQYFSQYLKSENKSLMIMGLKSDLKRMVSSDQIREYISTEIVPDNGEDGILLNQLNFQYFETSSKTDTINKLEFSFKYGLLMGEESLILDSGQHSRLNIHETNSVK